MKKQLFSICVAFGLMSTAAYAQAELESKDKSVEPKIHSTSQASFASIGIENLNFSGKKNWKKTSLSANSATALSTQNIVSKVSLETTENVRPLPHTNITKEDYMSFAELKSLYLEKKVNTTHALELNRSNHESIVSQNESQPHLVAEPLEAQPQESQDNTQAPNIEAYQSTVNTPIQNNMPQEPTTSVPYGVWPPIPDGPNSPQAQIEELKNYPRPDQQ